MNLIGKKDSDRSMWPIWIGKLNLSVVERRSRRDEMRRKRLDLRPNSKKIVRNSSRPKKKNKPSERSRLWKPFKLIKTSSLVESRRNVIEERPKSADARSMMSGNANKPKSKRSRMGRMKSQFQRSSMFHLNQLLLKGHSLLLLPSS